jgi:ubiquinone/menaquinone biosynthesis C-methylase UbiE
MPAENLPFEADEFDTATAIEVLEHVPDPVHTVAEMARCAKRHLLVSVPREPLWRALNVARASYLKDWGNTPGHLNHWSKRSFVALLSKHGQVVEARSPFPWTMLLVRL